MCMDVLLACMAGDHACAWCLRRSAEGVGSQRRVLGCWVLWDLSCELRVCGGAGLLEEQSPAFQPPPYLWF